MDSLIPSAGEGEVFGELLGDDDLPFVFNVDETETEDPSAKLQERLDASEREIAALKAAQTVQRQNIPTFEDGYRPPVQQPQPIPQQQVDPNFNKQIETELFSGNAAQVFQKFSAAAIEVAEQRATAKLIPLQASIVKQQIGYFKQQSNMEPEVAKEFDKLLKQYNDADLAKVDPSTVPEVLTNMKRIAFGIAHENGYVPQSARPRAPLYGGASTGGGTPLQRGQRTMKLTKDQENAVKLAREEYGWDDKTIYDALKNGEI